jgi:hypothetical protein
MAAGAITAVGLYSTYMADKANKDAADAAGDATQASVDAQMYMFERGMAAQEPYQELAEAARGEPSYENAAIKDSHGNVIGYGEVGQWDKGRLLGYGRYEGMVGDDIQSWDLPEAAQTNAFAASEQSKLPGYQQQAEFNATQQAQLPGYQQKNAFQASQDTALPDAPNLQALQYGQEANLPQYQQQLPGNLQDFSYDPNKPDSVTEYLRQKAKESTDKELSARGLLDSSTAIEQLANADLNVLANQQNAQYNRAVDEYGMNRENVTALANEYQTKYGMDAARANEMAARDITQYQSQYGKDIDTFNINKELSGTQYGREEDQYKFAYGQDVDTANILKGLSESQYGREMGEDQYKYAQGTDAYNILKQLSDSQYGRESGENAAENQRLLTQYSTDSSAAMDAFNLQNLLESRDYNRFIDTQKIGSGAAGSAGQIASNTGAGLAGTYNAASQNALAAGQDNAALWSGLASVPSNVIATNWYLNNMGNTNPTNQTPTGAYDPEDYNGR